MIQRRLINQESLRMVQAPFPYFTASANLEGVCLSALLSWFELAASWQLVQTAFYEQYELVSSGDDAQTPLAFFIRQDFLNEVRKEAGELFGLSFSPNVEWTVHKLLPGQRIRIHNDLLAGAETHRVILHVNRGWNLHQGGLLMFFNSPEAADVHKVLIPLNGSIVGFEISENSVHAVSLVFGGERFALVYSLCAENRHERQRD